MRTCYITAGLVKLILLVVQAINPLWELIANEGGGGAGEAGGEEEDDDDKE